MPALSQRGLLGELGTPGELHFGSGAELPGWGSAGSGLGTNALNDS